MAKDHGESCRLKECYKMLCRWNPKEFSRRIARRSWSLPKETRKLSWNKKKCIPKILFLLKCRSVENSICWFWSKRSI